MAEDAWNTRDPEKVALAYSPDTRWRDRSEFLKGLDAARTFLTRKWTTQSALLKTGIINPEFLLRRRHPLLQILPARRSVR